MVAALSHDLKTPVATIQATCEVLDLKYRQKMDSLTDDFEAAEDDGEKIRAIEANMQEVESNLEKIGYIFEKSETINQLVGNVFRATLDDFDEIRIDVVENDSMIIEGYFEKLTDYGKIILDNHIPECLVYIDKLRMEQVVDNIVGNSYKYAGTDIHVSFDEVEVPGENKKNDHFIKITVRDSGPGVPENELPLIVEKFYRGSDTNEKNGYGLGLYLVRHYMDRQGGGMEYYNDDGFVVELMVKKV